MGFSFKSTILISNNFSSTSNNFSSTNYFLFFTVTNIMVMATFQINTLNNDVYICTQFAEHKHSSLPNSHTPPSIPLSTISYHCHIHKPHLEYHTLKSAHHLPIHTLHFSHRLALATNPPSLQNPCPIIPITFYKTLSTPPSPPPFPTNHSLPSLPIIPPFYYSPIGSKFEHPIFPRALSTIEIHTPIC